MARVLNPVTLLMLKAPVTGQVKTRLAAALGAPAATLAYRRLVEHQLRQIPCDWPVHVCFSPANAIAPMRAWLGEECEYSAQTDGDLGQRLTAAMHAHFASSRAPLLFLGGDCPYLTTGHLHAAAAALARVPVVIVPADDGGYCLLGMRAPEPHLFTAIDWSTGLVAAQTRERLGERQLAWEELPPLEDVDDLAGWRRAVIAYPELTSAAGRSAG